MYKVKTPSSYRCLKVQIRFKQGSKSKNDRIVLVKTEGWEQITYRELFTLIKFFLENEQKIYPPPAKGAKYLLDAISRLLNNSVEDVLAWFQLKKPSKLHHFL